MAFFVGLLSVTGTIWLISKLSGRGPFQEFWSAGRLATTLMFVQVGIVHLADPDSLSYMIEGLLPFPTLLVILSGITEIVFGIGLLWNKTRRWAALLLIMQLIAVFPANINVAVNNLAAPGGLPSESWYTWSRLFFQPLYIYWIYRSSIYKEEQQLKAVLVNEKGV